MPVSFLQRDIKTGRYLKNVDIKIRVFNHVCWMQAHIMHNLCQNLHKTANFYMVQGQNACKQMRITASHAHTQACKIIRTTRVSNNVLYMCVKCIFWLNLNKALYTSYRSGRFLHYIDIWWWLRTDILFKKAHHFH